MDGATRLRIGQQLAGTEGRGLARITFFQRQKLQARGPRHFHHRGLAIGGQAIAAHDGAAQRIAHLLVDPAEVQRPAQNVQQAFAAVRQRHLGHSGIGMAVLQSARNGRAHTVGGQGILEAVAGDQNVHSASTKAKANSGLASPARRKPREPREVAVAPIRCEGRRG